LYHLILITGIGTTTPLAVSPGPLSSLSPTPSITSLALLFKICLLGRPANPVNHSPNTLGKTEIFHVVGHVLNALHETTSFSEHPIQAASAQK
jgi:hypothetical protein